MRWLRRSSDGNQQIGTGHSPSGCKVKAFFRNARDPQSVTPCRNPCFSISSSSTYDDTLANQKYDASFTSHGSYFGSYFLLLRMSSYDMLTSQSMIQNIMRGVTHKPCVMICIIPYTLWHMVCARTKRHTCNLRLLVSVSYDDNPANKKYDTNYDAWLVRHAS